jgi:hypothetical protein
MSIEKKKSNGRWKEGAKEWWSEKNRLLLKKKSAFENPTFYILEEPVNFKPTFMSGSVPFLQNEMSNVSNPTSNFTWSNLEATSSELCWEWSIYMLCALMSTAQSAKIATDWNGPNDSPPQKTHHSIGSKHIFFRVRFEAGLSIPFNRIAWLKKEALFQGDDLFFFFKKRGLKKCWPFPTYKLIDSSRWCQAKFYWLIDTKILI